MRQQNKKNCQTCYDARVKHFTQPMQKPKHEIIRQAIQEAGSTFCHVKFTKKDGTLRSMTFNPRDFNEILGTGKPCNDPNIIRIREVQNKEKEKTVWRSFDCRRVMSFSGGGKKILWGYEEK